MIKALMKAATLFCPTGRVIFESSPSPTVATLHLLKELKIRLDRSLEQCYAQTQRVQACSNKTSEEKANTPPPFIR